MNRLEMAAKLFENPKLKAKGKTNKGNYYSVYCSVGDGFKTIKYTDDNEILQLIAIENETWEIIEPKLKEFCYGEMVYLSTIWKIDSKKIKSCVSDLNYDRWLSEITLEELKGKWTIEGYYEEDANDEE